jgi:hypothetical protein
VRTEVDICEPKIQRKRSAASCGHIVPDEHPGATDKWPEGQVLKEIVSAKLHFCTCSSGRLSKWYIREDDKATMHVGKLESNAFFLKKNNGLEVITVVRTLWMIFCFC